MSAAKWEDVAYGLDRIAVPGGWLYRAFGGPDALSQCLCFVPDPTAPHVVAPVAPTDPVWLDAPDRPGVWESSGKDLRIGSNKWRRNWVNGVLLNEDGDRAERYGADTRFRYIGPLETP